MSPRSRPVKYARLSDVEAAAQRWTPGQIDCRSGLFSNTHDWRSHSAPRRKVGRVEVIRVVLRCARCGNMKHRDMNAKTCRWLNADGGWSPGPYSDGYLMTPGKGRVGEDGKERLRMMALSWMTVGTNEDDEVA